MGKIVKKKVQETDLESKPINHNSDLNKPQTKGEPLGDKKPGGQPIEYYDTNSDADIMSAMNYVAGQCASNAKKDLFKIKVSQVQTKDTETGIIKFFVIQMTPEKSYTIFMIGNEVYYRPTKEFLQICADIKDKVPGTLGIDSLRFSYKNKNKQLQSTLGTNRDDCIFIVYSIFGSMTGKSYADEVNFRDNVNELDINENAKIRKHNKLGTDGLAKNSKLFHDAKYGTSDENAFKQEIEDKQKLDGTVGALDQQPQESVVAKLKLPNVHMKLMTESKEQDKFMKDLFDGKKLDKQGFEHIEYEPGDRVLVGKDKEAGVVCDVFDGLDFGQVVTVMIKGHTVNATYDQIEPDLSYRDNWFALGMGHTTYYAYDKLNLDMRKRMHAPVFNEDTHEDEYEDMNGRNFLCNIVIKDPEKDQPLKLNYDYCLGDLQDIMESKKVIRVVNESGELQTWPIENVETDEEHWPYAVVVDGNNGSDEPLRKIRINPTSYVEADEDGFVDCIVNGEHTEMIKKNIKIIS